MSTDIDKMHDKVFITMNLCSDDLYMEVDELFEEFDSSYEICQRYYSEKSLKKLFHAIECAMSLCDNIPTKLQSHDDEQIASIGKLVNEDGYYEAIREAHEFVRNHQKD